MRLTLALLLALAVSACQASSQTVPVIPPATDDAPAKAVNRPDVPVVAPNTAPPVAVPTAALRPAASAPDPGPFQANGWTRFTTEQGLPSDDLLTVTAADIIETGIEQACILLNTPLGNSVWVGTNGAGLAYWDGTIWTTVTTTTPGTSLASNKVQTIYIVPRGRVLIGTSAGLSTYCQNKEAIRWSFGVQLWTPPTTPMQAITVVGNAHWYGHPNGLRGMYQGSYDQLFTTANGLGANDVRALVGDTATVRAWAGTFGGGVTRLSNPTRPFRIQDTYTTANTGISSNKVTSLAFVDGVLWIGHAPDQEAGRPGGVSRCIPSATVVSGTPSCSQWETFTVVSGALPSDDVRALALDKAGDLWVGTANGLARRAAATGAWTTYTVENTGGLLGSNVISGISIAPDGARWFSTRGGGLTRLVGQPPPIATVTPGPSPTPAPTRTATATPTATPTPTDRLFLPHVIKRDPL